MFAKWVSLCVDAFPCIAERWKDGESNERMDGRTRAGGKFDCQKEGIGLGKHVQQNYTSGDNRQTPAKDSARCLEWDTHPSKQIKKFTHVQHKHVNRLSNFSITQQCVCVCVLAGGEWILRTFLRLPRSCGFDGKTNEAIHSSCVSSQDWKSNRSCIERRMKQNWSIEDTHITTWDTCTHNVQYRTRKVVTKTHKQFSISCLPPFSWWNSYANPLSNRCLPTAS